MPDTSVTSNLALLRGTVVGAPRRIPLPNGDIRWSVELAVAADPLVGTAATTVPVVCHGPSRAADLVERSGDGDALVVVGSVRRRFFRAGGATQSRTEVVVDDVARAGSRPAVRRVVATAAARLGAGEGAALPSPGTRPRAQGVHP